MNTMDSELATGTARPRLRAVSSAVALLLAGLAVCAPVLAADTPAAAANKEGPAANAVTATAAPAKCSSVVIRNCRARFIPDPVAEGSQLPRGGEAPGRWEAVRNTDLDSEEILVEEDRLREPGIREVFERYLGAGPIAFVTRNALGGARCTTIVSTGVRFCSHPGAETPGSGLPHTDFSDNVF